MGKKVKPRRKIKWDSVLAVVLIAFTISGFYIASLRAEGKLHFSITGAFAAEGNPAPEGSEGLPAPTMTPFGKSATFSAMVASDAWSDAAW
ncbi:MAG: hypothetical protein AABX75_02080, partial [Nanoarchaeota archaeon]